MRRRPHLTRDQFGGTRLVNMVWLAALLAGVYFGVMYIPAWTEQWSVKSMLQDVGNSNWRHYDEEKVRALIVERCKKYNKPGKEYFVLDPENLLLENDENAKRLTLRMTWTRIIPYPFIAGKQVQRTFTQKFEVDTNPVKWESN